MHSCHKIRSSKGAMMEAVVHQRNKDPKKYCWILLGMNHLIQPLSKNMYYFVITDNTEEIRQRHRRSGAVSTSHQSPFWLLSVFSFLNYRFRLTQTTQIHNKQSVHWNMKTEWGLNALNPQLDILDKNTELGWRKVCSFRVGIFFPIAISFQSRPPNHHLQPKPFPECQCR